MAARAGGYRRSQQMVALYPVVLLVYIGIAWSDWWLPRHVAGEVFPFFSWSLFSLPRQDARLYAVHVTAVAEGNPRAAELLGRTLVDRRAVHFLRDPRFQKTATSLARAYQANKGQEVERLAVQLGNFLRPHGVIEYDLMRLSYHPLRYYRGEERAQESVVARFRTNPPP